MNPASSMTTDTHAALRDELAGLATEQSNAHAADLDVRSSLDLVTAMNREDATVHAAVASVTQAIAQAVDAAAERLARGGRLIYMGAGTAGRLGILDASECPPTFGVDPSRVVGVIAGGPGAMFTAVENAEDKSEGGAEDVARTRVGPDDVVVGISASGRTPYVLGALAAARGAGALTIGLACNAGSAVGQAADIVIDVEVGPELLSGSTRLKSGTAQKMVLNMLSTIVMIRLGKVYGSHMVDLMATNNKLRARSERTVMQVTGVPAEEAASAIAAAGGSVKVAIACLLTGLAPDAAQAALDQNEGHLRAAVTQTEKLSDTPQEGLSA